MAPAAVQVTNLSVADHNDRRPYYISIDIFFHRNPHRPAQNLTQKKQEQKQKYMNTNYENKNDNNYEKYRGIARPSLRK